MAMATPETAELLGQEPLSALLVGVVPLVLAVAQVGLGLLHGTLLPAVAFSVVLVVFAVVATGHHVAAVRVRTLERSVADR